VRQHLEDPAPYFFIAGIFFPRFPKICGGFCFLGEQKQVNIFSNDLFSNSAGKSLTASGGAVFFILLAFYARN